MVRTTETPRETPTENTLSATSTRERDAFLTLIEARWNEFDKATLEKAS